MSLQSNHRFRRPSRRGLLTAAFRAAAIGAVLVSAAPGVGPALANTNAAAAERFIDELGDDVLSVLNQPGLTEAQAIAEFGRLFRLGFDIPTIGRFVLGRYWNVATPEQRREFTTLFEQMVVHTYARRFSEYSGERFRIVGVREETAADTIVVTEVVQPGNPGAVQVAWRLRQRDSGPQIIDVIIEGVSMGVTQRQEFASVIERAGGDVDALIGRMREQVNSIR